MHKITARFFLPIFMVWMCLVPSRAYAFVPAAIGGYGLPSAASVATASGGSTAAAAVGAVDIFAAAALVAIGASISYFALDYMVGSDHYTARIPLTSAPALVVPEPSAPPTATQTSGYKWSYGSLTPIYADTRADACAAVGGTYNAAYFQCTAPCASLFSSGCNAPPDIRVAAGSQTFFTTCPSGYLVSGSSCFLNSARQAVPDKACDFQRSGSALAMISDPDCAASGQALPALCDGVTFICTGYGLSPSGQPRTWTATPRVDGGTTLTTAQQTIVSGQTQVQTTTLGISSAGAVDSVSGQVHAGYIPASTTGAATTPATTTATPATSPGVFPTDYARQGESVTAAAPLAKESTLLDLKTELSATGEANTVSTAAVTSAAALQLQMASEPQSVTDRASGLGLPALPGFLLPVFNSGACVPIGWTFQGRSVSFDLCPYVSTIKSISAWVLNLIGAALAFSMLMNFRAMRLRA